MLSALVGRDRPRIRFDPFPGLGYAPIDSRLPVGMRDLRSLRRFVAPQRVGWAAETFQKHAAGGRMGISYSLRIGHAGRTELRGEGAYGTRLTQRK